MKVTKNSIRSFESVFNFFKTALPYLSALMLVVTYVSAAIVHHLLIVNMGLSVVISALVATSIQGTRFCIVFFDLFTTGNLPTKAKGMIIGVVVGLLSISEVIYLVRETSINDGLAATMGVLLLMGIVLEIMMQNLFVSHRQVEIVSDKKEMKRITSFMRDKDSFFDLKRKLETEDNSNDSYLSSTSDPNETIFDLSGSSNGLHAGN